MGPNTRMEDYNKLYRGEKGLLPAKLVGFKETDEDQGFPRVESSNKHPILSLFSGEEGRVLQGVKFSSYYDLEPSKDAIPLMYLGEDPFVVYQKFRKGRAIIQQ